MIESPEVILKKAKALAARALFRRATALLRDVTSNQDATDSQRGEALRLVATIAAKQERHQEAEQARQERRLAEETRAAARRLEAALKRAKANPVPAVRFNTGIIRTPKREPSAEQIAAMVEHQRRQAERTAFLHRVAEMSQQGSTAAQIAAATGRPMRTVHHTLKNLRERSAA